MAISLAAGANLRDMCLGRFGGEEQGGAGHDTPARSCKILQDEVSFSKECPYTCKQMVSLYMFMFIKCHHICLQI